MSIDVIKNRRDLEEPDVEMLERMEALQNAVSIATTVI